MSDKKFNIDKASKEHPFKVPEQYFDALPGKIQEKVVTAPSARTWLSPRTQWVSVLAAAMILFFIGINFYPESDLNHDDLLSSVSNEDIIDYLESEELSAYEIAQVIDIEPLIDEMDIYYLDGLDEDLSEEDLEFIYTEIDFSNEI